ncbi:MAG: hypothetical protein Q9O74_03335 [Planctomycetota bacterium]|nr:hypothetical protein [Planctomycetota bacterium]
MATLRLCTLLALLCSVFSLVGCERGANPATPERPTDHAAPTPDSTGPRIVVLSPALGVMLTDLGLADRVVGRHGWDAVLDQSLPVCGDQTGLDYEALLRAEPTHLLTEWGARALPGRLTALAAEHDWDVQDFQILSLDDIASASARLRALFPDAAPADSMQRFERMVRGPPPEPIWQGRVLLLMGTSPIAALGPGSAHHELLLRAGGIPAIAEGSPYMPLHAEDVLRLAPDAIMLIQPRDANTPRAPYELGRIATLDISAIERDRIASVDHPQALLPSTRLVEVAEAMEQSLRRWARH